MLSMSVFALLEPPNLECSEILSTGPLTSLTAEKAAAWRTNDLVAEQMIVFAYPHQPRLQGGFSGFHCS